ncbi:MAG: hypothetical protein OQL06_09475 [Gammaproteobacteria bacterium]|nr:hypothetical protein [Gammaproteobacteria bacterium]
MNYNQLSLEQAPTIGTPLRFFLTAPVFAIAAALLLLFAGPDIFQSRWQPETLALTHLLTLGFITMVMMGALFQLLPVLAGASIPKAATISTIIHALYSLGVALFTFGLATTKTSFIKLALVVLIPALLIFLIAVSMSLFRAQSSHASVTGMRIAIASLWITLALGGILATGQAWDSVPLLRHITSIHIAWASIGWVTIMITAIAYQVVPMFQVTNDYPDISKRYFSRLIFICLLGWSATHFFESELANNYDWLNQLVIFTLCCLLIAFVSITFHLQIQRKKRLADASMYFWMTGLGCLSLSMLLYFYSEITRHDLSILIAIVFLTGFAFSVINGMLYKIVPFLVWLHLHRKLAFTNKGISGIPTMNEVISREKMLHQYYLHVVALILTVLAYFMPAVFFYPAALAWLTNWSLLFVHLVQAIQLYKTCLAST